MCLHILTSPHRMRTPGLCVSLRCNPDPACPKTPLLLQPVLCRRRPDVVDVGGFDRRCSLLSVGLSLVTAGPAGVGLATMEAFDKKFHRLVIRCYIFVETTAGLAFGWGLGSCRLSDSRINPHMILCRARTSVGGEGNVSTLFQIK